MSSEELSNELNFDPKCLDYAEGVFVVSYKDIPQETLQLIENHVASLNHGWNLTLHVGGVYTKAGLSSEVIQKYLPRLSTFQMLHYSSLMHLLSVRIIEIYNATDLYSKDAKPIKRHWKL